MASESSGGFQRMHGCGGWAEDEGYSCANQDHGTGTEHTQCAGGNARSSMVRRQPAGFRFPKICKRQSGVFRQVSGWQTAAQDHAEQIMLQASCADRRKAVDVLAEARLGNDARAENAKQSAGADYNVRSFLRRAPLPRKRLCRDRGRMADSHPRPANKRGSLQPDAIGASISQRHSPSHVRLWKFSRPATLPKSLPLPISGGEPASGKRAAS
jgi:hypothetical protein